MQFPLAIPPGGKATRPVFLPAMSVSQTYDIDFLPTDEFIAPPIARVSVDIQWPVDLLTKDAFLDPTTWQECYTPPPPWSAATRTTALFVGIVITLAFAATLLVRRAGVRFWSWAGVIALSIVAVLLWRLIWGGSALRETPLPSSSERTGLQIQTRRTGEYRFPDLSPRYAPLYSHRSEIEADSLIVHPEQGSRLTLRPDETRIFLEQREHETNK